MTVIRPNSISGVTSITAQVSDITIFGASSGFANITAGNISAAGTITYEDVTNVDSVGVITARSGVKIGPSAGVAGTFFADGSYVTAGVITATTFHGSGANLTGIDATQIVTGNTSVQTVDTGSDGHVKITTEGTERLRIDSSGRILIGTNSSLTQYGSQSHLQVAGTGYDASTIALRRDQNNANPPGIVFAKSRAGSLGGNTIVQSGDQVGSLVFSAADGTDLTSVAAEIKVEIDGTPGSNDVPGRIVFATTSDGASSATERLRITSDGKIGINDPTPSVTLETVGHNQVTFGSMPETIISYGTASAYNSGSAGSGIQFGGKYNSGGDYTIFAGVHGVKANTSDGPYGGALILSVRQNNTSSFERMRVSEYGSITNTTASSHSQGAGTFNIKGVINQYSQGSGSGLIFDCDFGRLTGYADNASIANSTDLSTALLHSTTDWVSSSSNTPMTVNGGSFNYRVGRGGYLDCVQNEGRVSVAAGSGSPNMAETLNTASMTIESWIWYDGAGREVIISRYGSGFPNQFNVIADPDGQFHYNSSGVGAGSGNITGQNFPDKTWHHHVWQYDAAGGTIHRWYINGAFANSADVGSSLAVSSATGFGIASRADDMERWDGKIAVVRIYNRALSAAEIKNHFELDRGRFGV